MYTVKGTIKYIFDRRKLAENFDIQELAVTIDKQSPYPQDVLFQMKNDNCYQLIDVEVGNDVEIKFLLRGKYGKVNAQGAKPVYNTLECYCITKI